MTDQHQQTLNAILEQGGNYTIQHLRHVGFPISKQSSMGICDRRNNNRQLNQKDIDVFVRITTEPISRQMVERMVETCPFTQVDDFGGETRIAVYGGGRLPSLNLYRAYCDDSDKYSRKTGVGICMDLLEKQL